MQYVHNVDKPLFTSPEPDTFLSVEGQGKKL